MQSWPKRVRCRVFVCRADQYQYDPAQVLQGVELEAYNTLPARKRADRLAGRVAAKRSIQRLLHEHDVVVGMHDIEISNEATGVPVCRVKTDNGVPVHCLVSIAHCDGYGIAVAGLESTYNSIGIDIECVRAFSDQLVRACLTEREWEACMYCNDCAERCMLIAIHWAAKEAYLKACKKGLTIHPRLIEVDVDIQAGTCYVTDQTNGVTASGYYATLQMKAKSYIVACIML